jgi:hypothetical protein
MISLVPRDRDWSRFLRGDSILKLEFGAPNGSLAKLQAGSHATATRRGSCRNKRSCGGSELQLT